MGSEKNIFKGDLTARAGVVYDYEEVTGDIDASGADTRTAFPKLTTVGGGIHARGADTRTAFPKLTTVGDGIHASGADTRTAFPKLTTVGGYIHARGADTRTAFPKLTTVGGYIDASGDFSHVHTNDPAAQQKCHQSIFKANLKIGYYYVDGILARLISRRGKVARVILIGKTEVSYVVEDGNGNYSHGPTLAKARGGLLYKLSSRDTSAFKKWTRKTAVTLSDAIKAYRAITGACEAGTRHFCEQKGTLPEKLTIAEAIKMTAGQYGNKAFAEFFAQ